MRVTIALFDIDGTLLSAGGAGRRAVEIAISEVLDGRDVLLESVEFAGRTDPWIIQEALLHYGVSADEELITEVIARYVEHLPEQLRLAEAFEVLPGVSSLIRGLSARDDVVLGLGTGNAERAAYAKLARGSLDGYFSFGGFGSDHVERTEVLRIGLERGRRRVAEGQDVRAVVIGDTPHDVRAARANGVDCVGVATGSYDEGALRAAGATVVVSDLRAAEVIEVLGGGY